MTEAPNIAAYWEFEKRLGDVREKNRGADSEEEDALLEEGDAAWWACTQEEREYLRKNRGPYYEHAVKWIP